MQTKTRASEWVNWSESVRFTPGEVCLPESEDEVVELVRRARAEGRTVRPVGHGHSSMPLMETGETLLDTRRLAGVIDHDREALTATVGAGSALSDLGPALHDVGLALENFGDVDLQAIGGAIGTGTHGTGIELGNFSSNLLGFRLVTGTGEVLDVGSDDVEELRAGRVALGALGVMTRLTLRVVPAMELHRREWCVHVDRCLERWEELCRRNRNFDFYWHPRRDEAQIRILNQPGQAPEDLIAELPPARGEVRKEESGRGYIVQPEERGLKFDEMEHALPIESFGEAFAVTRERVKAEHRREVAWRVLCRTVAADDGLLSPFLGRTSATIAHLHNAGMPYERYFADMEPRMRELGGRPHYGKKHTARAADLREMGLEVDRFNAVRERLDPDGVFLNEHLRELLGVTE
jgi:FAD/FMN-containing dehydrogenase